MSMMYVLVKGKRKIAAFSFFKVKVEADVGR